MANPFSLFKVKFSLFCLISIAVLSLLPGNQFPETDIQYADLAVHVLMYAMLTKVVFWEFKQFVKLQIRYLIALVCFLILFGATMEILQENLIDGRFGTWSDFIANSLGCFITLVLSLKKSRN